MTSTKLAPALPEYARNGDTASWEVWDDGRLRRGIDVQSWDTVPDDRYNNVEMFLGGQQDLDGEVELSINVHVNGCADLTAEQARQLAANLLAAADRLDEITREAQR